MEGYNFCTSKFLYRIKEAGASCGERTLAVKVRYPIECVLLNSNSDMTRFPLTFTLNGSDQCNVV